MSNITNHQAPRGPRTCEQHGICQGRYPACGRCDDPHPEDHALTLTPFEKMGYWVAVAALVATTVLVVGGVAGFLYGLYTGAGTP